MQLVYPRPQSNETEADSEQNITFGAHSHPTLKIEELLSNLGLLKNEIKVYLYLAEAGPKRANDICNEICIHRTETYRLLRNLEKKGVVFGILEKPIKFSAHSLDETVDLLIEEQRKRLQLFENQKAPIVELWESMPHIKSQAIQKGVFQKIVGEQQILLKANEVLERTNDTFQMFVSDEYLFELYYGGFFDSLQQHENLRVNLLTGISEKSAYLAGKLKSKSDIQIIQTQNLPTLMIFDQKEVLAAFTEADSDGLGHRKKKKRVAVWTNYGGIIATFTALFSKLQLESRGVPGKDGGCVGFDGKANGV